jgi:hypothetical protein
LHFLRPGEYLQIEFSFPGLWHCMLIIGFNFCSCM